MRTSNQKQQTARNASGNILTIVAIIGFVILVIGLWVIDLFWLHFLNAKELSAAEKVAMAAAVELNKDDSVGQMNYMLAHARELVLCQRCSESRGDDRYPTTKLLSKDLAKRAHDVAATLAAEAKALETIRIEKAVSAAKNAVSSAGSPNAAHLSGVATSGVSLNINLCSFGCAKKTPSTSDSPENVSPSNVEPSKYFFDPKVDSQFASYDKKYIDEASNLYKGNLPTPLDMNFPGGGDDPDLIFPLSSLAPAIKNYVSPPRLIRQDEFQKMAAFSSDASPRYIPSAVYVVLQVNVKDTTSGSNTVMMAPGVAVTNGASAPP